MARVVRIALDLTLYSIKTVRPVVLKVWDAAKNGLSTTKASFVLNNPVVSKAESLLESATSLVENKLISFRDSQLPGELKYLEDEIKKCKAKLAASSGERAACEIVRSRTAAAWPYVKVECVPPMTMSIFGGDLGQTLENATSKATNGVMKVLETQIINIDAAEARKKREAQAAVFAAQEKAKAEELKKKLEAEDKALEAKILEASTSKKEPATKDSPKPPPTSKKVEKKDPKKK